MQETDSNNNKNYSICSDTDVDILLQKVRAFRLFDEDISEDE